MPEQVHGPDAAGSWPVDAELVLRHDRMLRRLAGRLLRDPAAADDVVQETWLAAMRGGPGARAAWPLWLRRVVERLAGRHRRGEQRRAGRERGAARAEAVPGDDEVRAREAWRARVVDAVLALPEPYRGALLLRYLDALPPRDVARRMQVPAETVRTRTRRGIELLRQRLAESAPDWRHGAVLLLGWDRKSIGALAGGVGMTSVAMKGAAAVLVVGCGALLWWMAVGSDGSSGNADVPDEPALAMTAAVTPREETRSRVDEAAAAMDRVPVPSDDAAAPVTGALRILTRWSDDGTPAPGVFVAVRGEGSDESSSRQTFVRTDASGAFLMSGLAPGELRLTAPGRSVQNAGRPRIEAGETSEVIVAITRGLVVRGRVHDQDGRSVAGAAIWAADPGDTHPPIAMTHSDASGRFELLDVCEYCTLSARAKGHAPSARHVITQSRDGQPTVQDLLVTRDGSALRGRVITPTGEPAQRATLLLGNYEGGLLSASVILPDGTRACPPAALQLDTDPDGLFAAEGLPPGDLPLQVVAPGQGVWEGTIALATGRTTEQTIHLVRGGSVFGTAHDPDGSPAGGVRVRIAREPRIANAMLGERDQVTGKDGSFRFRDLLAGDLTLAATAQGRGRVTQVVRVEPGSESRCELRFASTTVIEGTLLDSYGRVQPGALVRVSWHGGFAHSRTGADGRFTLEEAPPHLPFRVRVTRADELLQCLDLSGVRPEGGKLLIRIPQSSEGSGRFRLRVVDAGGNPVRTAKLRLSNRSTGGGNELPVDGASGELVTGLVPAGSYTLRVEGGGLGRIQMNPAPLRVDEQRELGDVVLTPGAVLELRLPHGADPEQSQVHLLDADGIWVDRMVPMGDLLRSPLLAAGRYRVLGRLGEHVVEPCWIELRADQATQHAVELSTGVDCSFLLRGVAYWQRGMIEDEHGDAVAFLSVARASDVPDAATGRVLLAPGNYRARLRQPDGDLGAPQPFQVDAGSAPTIELRSR